jgi:hypothetical protein
MCSATKPNYIFVRQGKSGNFDSFGGATFGLGLYIQLDLPILFAHRSKKHLLLTCKAAPQRKETR